MLEGRVTVGGDYKEVCWREGSELVAIIRRCAGGKGHGWWATAGKFRRGLTVLIATKLA